MADFRPEKKEVMFYITMNMQSRQGNPIHQVACVVPGVKSLDDLHELLKSEDFILVEEYYKKTEGGYYSVGHLIINTQHIGKVKAA